VDFLLECIGFSPDQDLERLAELVRSRGEPVAWRGPRGEHLRLPLAPGLDLRLDREDGASYSSLYPHFQCEQRLRVAVEEVRSLPDSPFDALLMGRANPRARSAPPIDEESYALALVLTDARRLPPRVERGHVLAVAIAGFALDVSAVGAQPSAAPPDGALRFRDCGWIEPLGGADDPGGCVDLSLCIRSTQRFENPLSGLAVDQLVAEAPGRPLTLFVSPWQLEADGLETPVAGSWISGTFVLSGRVAGGLGGPAQRSRRNFG
jgi:hypothetical protein